MHLLGCMGRMARRQGEFCGVVHVWYIVVPQAHPCSRGGASRRNALCGVQVNTYVDTSVFSESETVGTVRRDMQNPEVELAHTCPGSC